MRWALLLSLIAGVALADDHPGRFRRFCSRTDQGRTERGFACDSFAFFEAFPANGAGMTGACSTTAPTGAKGEVLTFARSSNGTCTKTATGGLATTGIANGDLAVLSSNVARQEYDAAGVLGLSVEAARTNVLLRFIEYANAAWADVGTPTLTGSQTDPFGTTTAVQFEDDDGAAYEGRSQSVTVSAGAAYFAHCYVKAGSLAEARITLDGTAATITGLSATTWSIIQVADASSSGTSIAFQALNGDAVGDTGTVIWGGCQVEAGTYRTSIIPTTSATATRDVERPSFAGVAWPTSASISMAANFYGPTPASGSAAAALEFTGLASLMNEAAGQWRWFNTSISIATALSSSTGGIRTYAWHSGTNREVAWASNVTSGASVDATNKFGATLFVGGRAGGGNPPDAILSRICVDPDPSRCQ